MVIYNSIPFYINFKEIDKNIKKTYKSKEKTGIIKKQIKKAKNINTRLTL